MTTTIDTAKIRHENSADIVTHRLVRDLCDALDDSQARVVRNALSAACDLSELEDERDAERAKVARLRETLALATVLVETAPTVLP